MLAEVKSWLGVGAVVLGLLSWRGATRGDSPVDQPRAHSADKPVVHSPAETYPDAVAAIGESASTQTKITLVSHADATYHRPCKAADLVGLWKVVQWTTYIDKEKLNSYGHRHQWYLFSADGTLRSMTSTKPNENTREIMRTLEKLPAVISYSCAEEGKVVTTRKDLPNGSELWAASFVTKDKADAARKVDLRQGDVVMTLLDKKGRPLYVRQMRKLPTG